MNDIEKEGIKQKLARAGLNVRLFAVGAMMVGACGALMLTESAFNPDSSRPRKYLAAEAAAAPAEPEKAPVQKITFDLATPDEPEREQLTMDSFRKAGIDEYNMTVVVKEKKPEAEEIVLDPEDFTVPFPEDDTFVHDPIKRDPVELTDTRSVENEYFTVYDENSGRTVTMSGHELLCLMVNNEIGGTWGEEAIKAQTVAAYTHLRYNQEHGLKPTIGLRSGYSSRLEKCVSAVEGQALYYDGEIICAVYSASTAGYSTSAANIWGAERPYLQCVESVFDENDPNWGYTKTYSKEEVRAMLEDRFGITLSDDVTQWFTVDRVYSVKYIDSLTIDGREDCKLTGNQLCSMVGVKSNAIEIKFKDGNFSITSCGWGHGVGMSQWGCHYYAEDGWTYDQILFHYFIGTSLAVSEPSKYTYIPSTSTDDSKSSSEQTLPTDDTTWQPEQTTTTTTTTAPQYEPPAEEAETTAP